jgi:hypothetical protein
MAFAPPANEALTLNPVYRPVCLLEATLAARSRAESRLQCTCEQRWTSAVHNLLG